MKSKASTTEIELTIVKNFATYKDFTFTCLSDQGRTALMSALALGPIYQRSSANVVCRYFEIYLFLTDKHVTEKTLASRSICGIALGFIGAVYSKRFIDASTYTRLKYVRSFVRALSILNKTTTYLEGLGEKAEMTIREVNLAITFDAQMFSEEKLWLLRGWWVTNKNGLRLHLPLHQMYVCMGRVFTQRFYDACAGFVSGRAVSQIVAVRALIQFIASNKEISEARLLDRAFMSHFWRDFLIHYSQTSYNDGEGMLASTIISGWNNQFIPFVRDTLVLAGLFAPPLGGYPNPRGKVTGSHSNIALEDGVHVKTNLLTRVPLHLSDEQAVQTLFVDIRRDFDLIRKWAESEVERTNHRISRRIALETQGIPRIVQSVGTNTGGHKFISSQVNPQALANAAATLRKYGYVPRGAIGKDVRLLFPSPLNETAQELGLPVTGSLIPYLAILVAEHPAITTSYLENFLLFNTAGVRIGLAKTDGNYYLVGDKARRGAEDAEQQIPLSDAAIAAVEGLLSLTEPVRKYMREQGDDDWRFLLLSCGKGFGKPYRIRKLSPQTCFMERIRSIATGLHDHCDISISEAQKLATRFSLGRLRASAATLVYLETQSVHKMAKALGHKSFEPDLLSRYLPPALQQFFEERWIRIFQNGILAEALKDSRLLLHSTDFETPEELELFLSRHALRLLPIADTYTQPSSSKSEVLFGLDVGILTALVGIEKAVSDAVEQKKCPSVKALHWAAITRALLRHIESRASNREDLQEQLAKARQQSNPTQMEAFVYA